MVLAQIHPELNISQEALKDIDDFLFGLAILLIHGFVLDKVFVGPQNHTIDAPRKIYLNKGQVYDSSTEKFFLKDSEKGKQLIEEIKLRVINKVGFSWDLRDKVHTLLSGELSRHAIAEANKIINKFKTSVVPDPNHLNRMKSPLSEQAGLVFDIQVVRDLLGEITLPDMDDFFLTTVLEYISAELLELSGNVTRSEHAISHGNRRGYHTCNCELKISAKDLTKSIKNDEELRELWNKVKAFHLPDYPEDFYTNLMKDFEDYC